MIGETVENACRRELSEEAGVEVTNLQLVGVYSDPDRDPRGLICSVAFMARVGRGKAKAGSDAGAVRWVKDWHHLRLGFDHRLILADAARLRGRLRA
jgi:8-oxo-dGTP diphosphatase